MANVCQPAGVDLHGSSNMQNSMLILQLAAHIKPLVGSLYVRAREMFVIAFSMWLLIATSHPAVAGSQASVSGGSPIETEYVVNAMRDFGSLPISAEREPMRTLTVSATAYTSDPWETDDTPFLTASGTTVRHGVIAANFLPMGTHLRLPELYGERVFVVEDRMNRRYNTRIDIWMEEKQEARQFGIQEVTVEVF